MLYLIQDVVMKKRCNLQLYQERLPTHVVRGAADGAFRRITV